MTHPFPVTFSDLLRSEDDGAGSGGGDGGGQDDNGAPGGDDNGAGSDRGGGTSKVVFSPEQQAHIDRLLEQNSGKTRRVVEREFRQWLEEQGMDAQQRAEAERQRLAAERDEARREAVAARVETTAERLALKAGVKADRVDRFLRLVDLSDLESLAPDGKVDADAIQAAVDAELDSTPEFKGAAGASTPAAGTGADMSGSGGTRKQWTRAEIDKLSPAEFAEHEKEIMAQVRAGTVR